MGPLPPPLRGFIPFPTTNRVSEEHDQTDGSPPSSIIPGPRLSLADQASFDNERTSNRWSVFSSGPTSLGSNDIPFPVTSSGSSVNTASIGGDDSNTSEDCHDTTDVSDLCESLSSVFTAEKRGLEDDKLRAQSQAPERPPLFTSQSDTSTGTPQRPPLRSFRTGTNTLASRRSRMPIVNPRSITPRHTPLPSPALPSSDEYFSPGSTPATIAKARYDHFMRTSGPRATSSQVFERFEKVRVAELKLKERAIEAPCVLFNNNGRMYSIGGLIGCGGSGRVFFAMSSTADEVAIKIVHKHIAYRSASGRARLLKELEVLKRVTEADLSFVCPLLSSWADEDNVYMEMVRANPTWMSLSILTSMSALPQRESA